MDRSEIREPISPRTQYVPASTRIRERAAGGELVGKAADVWGKILPDGLSLIHHFDFLTDGERRFVNRIQGRTYANLFEFVSRYMKLDVLQENRDQWRMGQATHVLRQRFEAQEFSPEDSFSEIEYVVGRTMASGYQFVPNAGRIASVVSTKSLWAMLALTLNFELSTQQHFDESIAGDESISPLFKDAFLSHRSRASLNAVISELEWILHDAKLMVQERDKAVKDFVELLEVLDRILQAQARADMQYFAMNCDRPAGKGTLLAVEDGLLKAYRWQYIFSGMRNPRYTEVSSGLVSEAHTAMIQRTLASFEPKI